MQFAPLGASRRGANCIRASCVSYENKLEKKPFGAGLDFLAARFADFGRDLRRALGRVFAFGRFAFFDLALRAIFASVIVLML
jgi:hypothetical protein